MAGDSEKGDSSSPCTFVVDRIISSTGEIPKLTKTNYHEWALEVQVNLEGMELWDAVESGSAEHGKDRRALDAILRGVQPEMKSGLAAKKTVKDAWAAIKSLRMSDAHVQEAKAQHLLKQFENVSFKDGEAINDFAVRLNSLAAELRELGEKMEEQRVVKKMLRVVPARYNQITCSIEMFADMKTMSMEELVGRLRVAEERCGGGEVVVNIAGLLLLTEEQWEARRRERCGKERARRGDDEKNRGHSGSQEDSDEDDDDGGSNIVSGVSRRRRSSGKGRCFNCGVRGHFSRERPKPRKEEALYGDAEEGVLL
jgi:hypothetical protein